MKFSLLTFLFFLFGLWAPKFCSCQIDIDSLFEENFQYCDFVENHSTVFDVDLFNRGLLANLGNGSYWLLDDEGQFVNFKQYTHQEVYEYVSGLWTYEPTNARIRIQNVNNEYYKYILESKSFVSWGPGSECHKPEIRITDYFEDSINSYTIDLVKADLFFPPSRVFYDFEDTYFIFSKTNPFSFCEYAWPGEPTYHFVSYNENSEELNYIETPYSEIEFLGNRKTLFFHTIVDETLTFFRINEDLSYQAVYTPENPLHFNLYGEDRFIFFFEDRFEIYDESLNSLFVTVDYDFEDSDIFHINGEDIYIYSNGVITKIDNNFLETIVYEVEQENDLPNVRGMRKLGNKFCIFGSYNGAVYINVFDESVQSLSCNPIDECTDIILDQINPKSMKSELDFSGLGSDYSLHYKMLMNADFTFTNNDTIEVTELTLKINNHNFAPLPDGGLTGYATEDFSHNFLTISDIYLPPNEQSQINLTFSFNTNSATAYLATPPLEELYSVLDDDLSINIESASQYKACNHSEVYLNPQNLFQFIDQDCDGYFILEDCNDLDSLINPLAEEVANNGIDEN